MDRTITAILTTTLLFGLLTPTVTLAQTLSSLTQSIDPTTCSVTVSFTGRSGNLTSTQVNDMLSAHNELRKSVTPAAKPPLVLLKWNDKLANYAANRMKSCDAVLTSSSPSDLAMLGFTSVGENIAVGTMFDPTRANSVVMFWASDKDKFSNVACTTNAETCAHYTQMIWSDTTEVGCGYAFCPGREQIHYWECNYGEGGNKLGQQPYSTTGTSSSSSTACATAAPAAVPVVVTTWEPTRPRVTLQLATSAAQYDEPKLLEFLHAVGKTPDEFVGVHVVSKVVTTSPAERVTVTIIYDNCTIANALTYCNNCVNASQAFRITFHVESIVLVSSTSTTSTPTPSAKGAASTTPVPPPTTTTRGPALTPSASPSPATSEEWLTDPVLALLIVNIVLFFVAIVMTGITVIEFQIPVKEDGTDETRNSRGNATAPTQNHPPSRLDEYGGAVRRTPGVSPQPPQNNQHQSSSQPKGKQEIPAPSHTLLPRTIGSGNVPAPPVLGGHPPVVSNPIPPPPRFSPKRPPPQPPLMSPDRDDKPTGNVNPVLGVFTNPENSTQKSTAPRPTPSEKVTPSRPIGGQAVKSPPDASLAPQNLFASLSPDVPPKRGKPREDKGGQPNNNNTNDIPSPPLQRPVPTRGLPPRLDPQPEDTNTTKKKSHNHDKDKGGDPSKQRDGKKPRDPKESVPEGVAVAAVPTEAGRPPGDNTSTPQKQKPRRRSVKAGHRDRHNNEGGEPSLSPPQNDSLAPPLPPVIGTPEKVLFPPEATENTTVVGDKKEGELTRTISKPITPSNTSKPQSGPQPSSSSRKQSLIPPPIHEEATAQPQQQPSLPPLAVPTPKGAVVDVISSTTQPSHSNSYPTYLLVGGRGVEGQLGFDSVPLKESFVVNEGIMPQLKNKRMTRVFVGGYHSFVLLDDNTLFGFGDNTQGQVGVDGPPGMVSKPTEVHLPYGCTVISVHCGESHTLVLTNIGMYVFGSHAEGQLGLGPTTSAYTFAQPTRLALPSKTSVKLLACGSHHNLMTCSDGNLYSFGYNECGQLMLGDTTTRSSPTVIPEVDGSSVTSLACGVSYSVVVSTAAGVLAAGE
eukprot:PhF_6_TR27189/c0_g2_i1/m.39931